MKNIKAVIFIMTILIAVCVFSSCTVNVKEAVEAVNIIENEEPTLANTSEEKMLTYELTDEVTEEITQEKTEPAIQTAALIEVVDEVIEETVSPTETSAVTTTNYASTTATETSLVTATEPPPPKPPRKPNEKLIAITFDDGPTQYTEQILDILTQYGGKSTFFVVGYKVWDYREIIKKTTEQGSEVAGHSWHHYNFLTLEEQDMKAQITYTADALKQVTEVNPPYFYRIPYGKIDDRVKDVSRDIGYALIQWNIDPRDWSTRNADAVYENIMDTAKDGGIIVCHDTHETTAIAMERVIPELVEQGYRLVTVSELLWYTEPGRVYYSETQSVD